MARGAGSADPAPFLSPERFHSTFCCLSRWEFRANYPEGREWVNPGNSCIVDPTGKVIAGPAKATQEILHAEVDLGRIAESKRMFDAAGHCARPDVFRFEVDRGA